MSERIVAPWTPDQVWCLNRYQRGGWFHPFTCGRCRDADPLWLGRAEHPLLATEDGWVCPACDYTQDWAYCFMLDGAPVWFDSFAWQV